MRADAAGLCLPDRDKSCFACCPPIRPPGYEHLQYMGMIQRVLRENTSQFQADSVEVVPITGFSCWALGYLDPEFRLVGCLLHPGRNSGRDMRYRVDYGEKCGRETCREARIFRELRPETRAFWLHLAEGLDSFRYSSRKENPLFNLLNWGPKVLSAVAREESYSGLDKDTFFRRYPFFRTHLSPQAAAYPAEQVLLPDAIGLIREESFLPCFESLCRRLAEMVRAETRAASGYCNAPFTHLLPMKPSFLDFVRLSAGITRLAPELAAEVKRRMDGIIEPKVSDSELSEPRGGRADHYSATTRRNSGSDAGCKASQSGFSSAANKKAMKIPC